MNQFDQELGFSENRLYADCMQIAYNLHTDIAKYGVCMQLVCKLHKDNDFVMHFSMQIRKFAY